MNHPIQTSSAGAPVSRRGFFKGAAASGAIASTMGLIAPGTTARAQERAAGARFSYCLNTSTIRDHKLPLEKSVELIAQAGYDSIEPWINELVRHRDSGGKLSDLGKKIADLGLKVESGIGFANWIVDDDAKRAKGLEDAKRDMEMLRQIGGTRIAAPPVGATNAPVDLFKAAERYRALLEAAKETGVIPQVELWGFSKSLSRIGEVAFVAAEAAHPDACVLTDVYHIFKGGSGFEALNAISGNIMHVMHLNDYPDLPRETIADKDRVYPGDGVAPLDSILSNLVGSGFGGVLSLELFNREYGKQPVEMVLQTGLVKMKAAVASASKA